MAKGNKRGERKHRLKKTAKKVSKGEKRHFKEYGEQHPVDEEYEGQKALKRPRKEVVNTKREDKRIYDVVQDLELESSGSEDNADPYLELLGMFGIDSGSDVNQLAKRWKENESEEEKEHEIRDGSESKSGKKKSKDRKQVKGDIAHIQSEKSLNKRESINADDDRTANAQGDCDSDKGEESSGAAENEDDGIDQNEVDADDYRKENEAVEESDDDKEDVDDDEDVHQKARPSAESNDPFVVHFEQDLDDSAEKHLSDITTWEKKTGKIPTLGSVTEILPSIKDLPNVHLNLDEETTFTDLKVKARLGQTWAKINHTPTSQGLFTPLQQKLFHHINSYKDVFFSSRTFKNGDDIRRLYCLHAVNHILKTRSRVVKNTARIVQSWKDKKEIGELRDQGLTRPKVVILVPFRDAALKVVEVMMQLICGGDRGQVMNKKRFYDEFGDKEEIDATKDFRPEDFKLMFSGNIDDCFRVGISVSKKSMTLYAKFYSSDIIVASPLGLRTIIGSEGEKSHEYDFLSSIEIIVMDQTDVFLMQNWEHVQHIFQHLHLQPKDSHDVDFSRVRMWCLNGWSKYYRQSLIFSRFVSPEINSLFNRQCSNFAGKVKACPSDVLGSICQVVIQVPQAFHRFECSSFAEAADKRFNYFTNKVLPEFKGSLMGHTAIFVPSYFDFVRLRNYFKREAIECALISEYSQQKEIQRARTYFQQGRRPFLLFTERFYFFYRYRIKGIKNIIFYELPRYSIFYSDILNYMDTRNSRSESDVYPLNCTVLYTKLNALRLAGVVGTQRCSHMISSEKNVHMFVTGDDEV